MMYTGNKQREFAVQLGRSVVLEAIDKSVDRRLDRRLLPAVQRAAGEGLRDEATVPTVFVTVHADDVAAPNPADGVQPEFRGQPFVGERLLAVFETAARTRTPP